MPATTEMDLEGKYTWNSSYHLNKWFYFIHLWHDWIKVCLESWNYDDGDPLSNKFLERGYKFSKVNQAHQLAELANGEYITHWRQINQAGLCIIVNYLFPRITSSDILTSYQKDLLYLAFFSLGNSANWIQTCFLNISNFTILMITSKLYAKQYGQFI